MMCYNISDVKTHRFLKKLPLVDRALVKYVRQSIKSNFNIFSVVEKSK